MHSAILLTCIKLPFVNKICVLSIFEWPLKTGVTVHVFPYITFCGCSLADTSTELGGFMDYVVLFTGAPEGLTGSGSGLKHLCRWCHCLKSHLTD